MTLNGLARIAAVADDLPPEIEALGLTAQRLQARAQTQLTAAGIQVVALDEALRARDAGKLRIRLVTNRDAYGVYYYGMKLELRQKIPLGNPAGGFVSQIVWNDGESGAMKPNETGRPLAALDRLLAALIADYRAQNPAPP